METNISQLDDGMSYLFTGGCNTMKNKLFILLLAFVLLLSACSNNPTPDNDSNEVVPEPDGTNAEVVPEPDSTNAVDVRAKKFIENFEEDYPSFILLGYIFGSAENDPIQVVAIALDEETGSSSTVFVLDENGVGQVGLAAENLATFREEDGLYLDKNVISLSLNLEISSTKTEIHDYKLTVYRDENQPAPNIVYASNETIRS